MPTYTVNSTQNPDSSFKSFICALLVFLALCILISLSIFFSGGSGSRTKSEATFKDDEDSEPLSDVPPNLHQREKIIVEVPPESTTIKKIIQATVEEYFDNEFPNYWDNEIDTTNGDKKKIHSLPITSTSSQGTTPKVEDATVSKSISKIPGVVHFSTLSRSTKNIEEYPTETSTKPERIKSSISRDIFDKIKSGTTVEDFDKTSTSRSTKIETIEESADKTTLTEEGTTTSKVGDLVVGLSSSSSSRTTESSDEVSKEETTNFQFSSSTPLKKQTAADNLDKRSTFINIEMEPTEETVAGTTLIEESTTSTTIRKIVQDIEVQESEEQTTRTSKEPRSTRPSSPTPSTKIESSEDIFEEITERPDLTNETCTSDACNSVASEMLGMMKHSAQPCEEFYQFACGRAQTKLSKNINEKLSSFFEKNKNGSSSTPLDKFVRFYQGCVNYERNFDYKGRLEKLFEDVFVGKNVSRIFAEQMLGQNMPFFEIEHNFGLRLTIASSREVKNSLNNWSIMEQARTFCLKDRRFINSLHAVEECEEQIIGDMLSNSIQVINSSANIFQRKSFDRDLSEIMEETLGLLKFVKKSIKDEVEHGNHSSIRVPISDLQTKYKFIDWIKFFQELTGSELLDESIEVFYEDHFQRLFSKLRNMDQSKLLQVLKLLRFTNLYQNTVLPKQYENRENYCIELSRELMPDIVTYFVYGNKKSKNTQSNLDKIFINLKKALAKRLEHSADFKLEVQELDQLNPSFVPDLAFSGDLAVRYKNLYINEDHQNNIENLIYHYRQLVFSDTTFNYFMDPYSNQPQSFYSHKQIYIPLGLWEDVPEELPDYLIEARISFKLAREIAKHFSPFGDRADFLKKTVSYRSLLTYNKDMLEVLTKAINGTAKFGDNKVNDFFIDTLALVMVFDTINITNSQLLPWISFKYSREKLFFIAIAQEFCSSSASYEVLEETVLPAEYRVDSLVANTNQFASSFGCIEGVRLNYGQKAQFPCQYECN